MQRELANLKHHLSTDLHHVLMASYTLRRLQGLTPARTNPPLNKTRLLVFLLKDAASGFQHRVLPLQRNKNK